MDVLRRLFGGGERRADDAPVEDAAADHRPADEQASPPTSMDEATAEARREHEILRAEAQRLDELQQRQLRYADQSWTPPAQGGERRADDEDAPRAGG